MDLSGNLITELPAAALNRLKELQHLNLARNKLNFLPSNLRGLANLRRLDLSENSFRDIPADLGGINQLGRLKSLYVNGNPLAELEGLKNPSLQFLSADSCGKKGGCVYLEMKLKVVKIRLQKLCKKGSRRIGICKIRMIIDE